MKNCYLLQEHGKLANTSFSSEFNGMKLIEWKRPMDNCPYGYYASFVIGAEWTKNRKYAVVVTPKKGMENIDFVSMFYYCFSSGLDKKTLSKIYSIEISQPPILVNSMNVPMGLLTIVHFLSVTSRIRCLKKGYIAKEENLRKIRGRVEIIKNDRVNLSNQRYHHIYCEYNDYTVDIPENRIIKKAILFSQKYIKKAHLSSKNDHLVNTLLTKCKTMFADVSPIVNTNQIMETRYHKLFKEYGESIRLAKLILRQYDYNIHKVGIDNKSVIPFTIDMSLLYEHYVYGLLYEAYKGRVKYQFKGDTGYPDFLYCSTDYKAILDTKYIPRFKEGGIDNYIIRQLSGYGRDKQILSELGYDDFDKTTLVPCIVLYPTDEIKEPNPFKSVELKAIEKEPVEGILEFYKIAIPIPVIK